MQVFWENGFGPAAIADLLEGTGLSRGSFYNAFASKRQLFVKSLLKYDQHVRQVRLARLEAPDNPAKAITRFFDTIVVATAADRQHKGCFLINIASEIGTHDEQGTGIVTNGIREVEAFFRRSIEVGQARGDLPKGLDPELITKELLALMVAIRVLGCGVFAEDALHTIADAGKRLICESSCG